jgi:hypothetical protein
MSLITDYNPDEFRDPISKKWMTQWEWKKKYGDGRLAALLDAHNRDGMPIPEKLIAEIQAFGKQYEREMREKFKPRVAKQEPAKVKEQTPAETKKQEEWFAKVDAKIVDNMKRSDCHRNPTGLLLILLLNRSFRGKKDKHKTWYYWHQDRKLIVASISKTKLAEVMGVSLSSVYRYTSQLVANGDIRVEIENGENVYVLGFINGDGNEVFYYTQADKQGGMSELRKGHVRTDL